MKKILLLIFLLMSIINFAQGNKKNCAKYKTGTYITTNILPDGSKLKILYTRTNNLQTETVLDKDGKPLESHKLFIIWINDCKYILRSLSTLNKSKHLVEGDIICKIIETGDDYYVVKAKLKGSKWMQIKMNVYKP